ncbi:MAG: hypothetical protein JXR22_06810 [Prolixibacteraceae bacterium]|nr:hypothetical protein [Prolixibacteraceae bacterium]
MKHLFRSILVLLLFTGIFITSCDDENYFAGEDAKLAFSVDTLMFDTIFTTIGSTTQSFRVINPYNQPVLISSIRLAGGEQSKYRLNIDGELTNELFEVELAAKDSIYIFVELTIDPNGTNQPMIVQDSIIFSINSNIQDLDLMAWGQDFIPVNKEIITTSTWTAEKPYLVYDYAYVDSGEVLTIEPGARIYFHKGAGLYGKGAIKAIGTFDKPIVFKGDRLEEMYFDIPDQWQGILLYPGDHLNEFENVNISGANIGLQVGTIEDEGAANARLHNVKIEHMAFAGIFALKSNIDASNTLVTNCGRYCVTLLVGGNYNFNHCTIANYWGFKHRETASLVISNQLIIPTKDGDVLLWGDLEKANWRNSIVWGNIGSELELGHYKASMFNYRFENCIVKVADSIDTSDPEIYQNIFKNIDPLFIGYDRYDYQLDTLSPAKDTGLKKYGDLTPLDLNNVSRMADVAPDLGVFERVETKDEK